MDRVRSAGSSKVSARRGRALIALALAVVLVSYSVPIPVSATDGAPDTFFDSDGKLTTDFFGGDDQATAVAVQSDGKIVVAGYAYDPASRTADFALARYNADGSLDTTFDSDGKLTTDFFGGSDASACRGRPVGRQDRGRRVSSSAAGGTADFALARYNADGSLDTAFDSDGKLTTDFARQL